MTQTLLYLIRVGMQGTKTLSPEQALCDVCWSEVYKMAAEQGVAAIAWRGVQQLISEGVIPADKAPDRATKLRWALHTEQTAERYRKQRNTIIKLCDIYSEAGIKMLILKGYGISLLYPHPEDRACCDIDIWLFGEQQRADDLLRQKLNIKIDEDRHHHTVFYVDGVMVENHYDFLNIASHLSNRDIEQRLKALATTPESFDIDGRTIYRPNANHHALFLVRHAAAHFAAVEIVLRHIIDWAMFVRHYHNDIDWEWLRGVCQFHNMDKFLDTLNALASEICDIDLSLMPGTVRRKELEHRILNDILTPEFSEHKPDKGLFRVIAYKCRRWWANRWKQGIVYQENTIKRFFIQVYGHIAKPKSISKI
ncbi:MAG: nucleotidyltransferase family protein [Alistipes sp.]|nr:nucleotidyltransferase family protein [Alistipes sp.]